MNMRSYKPLSLAVLVALAACSQKNETPATDVAATPDKPVATVAAPVDLGATSTLKVSDLDTSINPCTDLHGFVDNKWLAANPIPSDHTSWGTFELLDQRSENAQKAILEGIAKTKPAAGSLEQLVGDFYASGMDEAKINGTPDTVKLKPYLDTIDAIKTPDDIASYIDSNYAKGLVDVFGFGGQPDFKNSSMVIGYAFEGGTNLPEKAYYSDPQYQKIRDAYVAHIAKTLQLGGVSADDAKKQADAVMAIETQLAAASLSPVEQRDTKNQYHMRTVAEADKITPHFSWEKFFDGIGVKDVKGFSLAEDKFFSTFDTMLTKTSVDDWKAYLRFHAIDNAASYLNDDLVTEHFDFYNKT
ncbi:MAG: M13 family metallopeptidase N-terminal domain-containing protein, partial [Lysobacteraceae bacterium]